MTSVSVELGQPWWKFGHVWLVIAGPATVVLASFVTVYLAVSGMDPVVDEDYYRKGLEINKTLSEAKGGWKVLMWAGGAASAAAGIAGFVAGHWGSK